MMLKSIFGRCLLMLLMVLSFSSSAMAAKGDHWLLDIEAAKEEAASSGKDVLIYFTGSDWCPPCQAWARDVFDQPAFLEMIGDKAVLVLIDFPREKPVSPEQRKHNLELGQYLQFPMQFPKIYITDAAGQPYGIMDYQPGGPADFMIEFEKLRRVKATRDEKITEAETLTGLAKAKALDEALSAMHHDLRTNDSYSDLIDTIIELDSEDRAELKSKYERLRLIHNVELGIGEAQSLLSQQKYPEAMAKVEEVIANYELQGEMVIPVRLYQARAAMSVEARRDAIRYINQAIEATDPSEVKAIDGLKAARDRIASELPPE